MPNVVRMGFLRVVERAWQVIYARRQNPDAMRRDIVVEVISRPLAHAVTSGVAQMRLFDPQSQLHIWAFRQGSDTRVLTVEVIRCLSARVPQKLAHTPSLPHGDLPYLDGGPNTVPMDAPPAPD